MPMEGSSEEYEKLALAALKKAASADSDPTYHNTRAAIFAYLAQAAASSEMAESLKVMSNGGVSPAPARGTDPAQRPGPSASPVFDPAGPGDAPRGASGPSDSNGSTPGTALVPRTAD